MTSPPVLPFAPDPQEAGSGAAEMRVLLSEQPGVEHMMRQLVDEALRATFCDAAALVLTTNGEVVAASATGDVATQADDLQWEDNEGPPCSPYATAATS